MLDFKKNKCFKLICIFGAVFAVLAPFFLPAPDGLSAEGWKMLGIIIMAMILFISEALPLSAVCFSIIIALKYTGVLKMTDIIAHSGSTAIFFCIAAFGIAAALQNTNLNTLILQGMYKLGKGNTRRMVSVLCCLSAALSIFCANGVAQIVLISIALGILRAIGNPEPGSSRFAGAMMMAIYVGATTGGMFLPCSNGPNVVIMEMSEMISGKAMTFLQWGIFGIPCGLVLTLFAAWRIPRYFQPEELTELQKQSIEEMFMSEKKKLEKKDYYFLVIMGTMILLWFASNWYKKLDVATIAMAGMVLMMAPGINLLSTKDFKKNFSPMNVVVLLCTFPLAYGAQCTGVGEWVANSIFGTRTPYGTIGVYALATIAAFLVHCLIPTGSANAALSTTIIGPVLVSAGVPVQAAIMLIGIQAGTGFLFPIEGTWQYTFGLEHYSFSDCIKSNWPITLLGMLLCTILIPLLALAYSSLGLI